jgi:hypothetical protein
MAFIPFITKIHAAGSDIVGNINNPLLGSSYGNIDKQGGGLALLITNVLRLFFVVAGMLAFFNFILAGFQYMTAAGDSKALQKAWDRIWQSLLGLVIIAVSFVLAALFGYLIFGDPLFMLRPQIFGPQS